MAVYREEANHCMKALSSKFCLKQIMWGKGMLIAYQACGTINAGKFPIHRSNVNTGPTSPAADYHLESNKESAILLKIND